MKFLLFFISMIFSVIFYIFHGLSVGKDIFGNTINNSFHLQSFSGNLLIESFIFFIIAIVFIYIFSDIKGKSNLNLASYKIEILYFLFYILIIGYVYLFFDKITFYIITIFIFFILSDIIFNHISNIQKLTQYKIKLKYIGLILNYISSLLAIVFILQVGNSALLYLILIFNIIFNFLIHKNYINYISLLISIIITIFLLYSLYFLLLELYILYI